MNSGKQPVYRIMLVQPSESKSTSDQPGERPPEVQAVIDKHSGEGGMLCGDIPAGQTAKGFKMRIELEPGARPVNIRQYRLTPREEAALLKKVEEFIARGWIELFKSPWNSAILFVPKPNGDLRFCVDFRFVNSVTQKDANKSQLISDIVDKMHGANFFSALDLCSGFYQIPLEKHSRAYTSFSTPLGLFQWCVMPMGLSNSPAVFQRAMNQVLAAHIKANYCLVYLDDILIMSTSAEEHAKHLDAVLTSLHEHNLCCQLPKCEFALPELRYLGHLVSGVGVRPDPKKVAVLDQWVPPFADIAMLSDVTASAARIRSSQLRITKAARSFMGFMQYFSRFIPRFSELAAPLYDLTRDPPASWSAECAKNWQTLKSCLSNTVLMYHPNVTLPYHVCFDASIRGVGGLLAQEVDNVLLPIAFCARRMQKAEVNYMTTEQEYLVMVYCFYTWRCYLEGITIFAHTDHEPLTWLASQTKH